MIAEEMGFDAVVPVSGQTYSRKVDYQVCSVLAGIAQSASKFSNDIRILQSFKEIEEPFEKNQIGSSAMAYKRNPMRDERITSLARYVMCDVLNPHLPQEHSGLRELLTTLQTKGFLLQKHSSELMLFLILCLMLLTLKTAWLFMIKLSEEELWQSFRSWQLKIS